MKKKEKADPTAQVHLVPIEGCVVGWDTQTQVNYQTGEIFDFNGDKIYDMPEDKKEA